MTVFALFCFCLQINKEFIILINSTTGNSNQSQNLHMLQSQHGCNASPVSFLQIEKNGSGHAFTLLVVSPNVNGRFISYYTHLTCTRFAFSWWQFHGCGCPSFGYQRNHYSPIFLLSITVFVLIGIAGLWKSTIYPCHTKKRSYQTLLYPMIMSPSKRRCFN